MTQRLRGWLELSRGNDEQTASHKRKQIGLVFLTLALAVGPALMSFAQTTAGPPAPGVATALPVPQATATPFKILPPFVALGQGTGVDTFTTCPDVACPTGDTCVCEEANGNIKGQLIGSGKATFTFEVSINATSELASGSFGYSYGTQGIGTITLPNGTDKINLLLQGTAFDVISGSNTGFTGSYLVNGGAGKFATAQGVGTYSYNLNFATGPTTVVMDGTLSQK